MEDLAGVAATSRGGGSLPMPSSSSSSSSSSRKEWRAIPEHSVRNAADEKMEHSKLGQSDERTIYVVQHGGEHIDVDFGSITIDGTLDDNILHQRIHNVTRQREELQQVETELRAQIIARSEIIKMRNSFHAEIKDREDAAVKLQDQLSEREQTIHNLERRMEEKDRELHAIKLDNEAAWAKEDLLREQNKELATFRRERDHSEAERAQHLQQICDMQEHIQDKERQILELQEQHRADQETIFMKDEQLKMWIARVQEMDALQSNTSHSLQTELRERTDQYNHLWLGCQRQFAEMERLHVHSIQQLQFELADARKNGGSYPDESQLSQTNSKDITKFDQKNGTPQDVNGNGAFAAINAAMQNGNADRSSSFASGNASNQVTNHVAGVPIAPTSLLGMPTYLPPGQMAAVHPYILHQEVSHSMPSHAPQSHVGHFHSMTAQSSLPQWQNQQAVAENAQLSKQNPLPSSETDLNFMRTGAKYVEMPVNGYGFHPDYLDVHISQVPEPDSVISSSTGEPQVHESIDRTYLVASQPEQGLHHISSQFKKALRLSPMKQNSESLEQNVMNLKNQGIEDQVLTEQPSSAASASLPSTAIHSSDLEQSTIINGSGTGFSEVFGSTGTADMVTDGKALENALLDERSLLSCIVRTIPSAGRIRINSTLPNRLGKMLSPLHWNDYKKKYGKLDDFVSAHPELFFIEDDYIQLREGAQKIIAATAAVAKVAAAASSPYSSFLPSMAVTPVAQSHRLKKVQSIEPKLHNGVNFGVPGSISNVKILSKSKSPQQLNGSDFDGSSATSSHIKGSIHGMPNSNFVGKQQGRTTGAALTSRR